jgi:hypothetical protein
MPPHHSNVRRDVRAVNRVNPSLMRANSFVTLHSVSDDVGKDASDPPSSANQLLVRLRHGDEGTAASGYLLCDACVMTDSRRCDTMPRTAHD